MVVRSEHAVRGGREVGVQRDVRRHHLHDQRRNRHGSLMLSLHSVKSHLIAHPSRKGQFDVWIAFAMTWNLNISSPGAHVALPSSAQPGSARCEHLNSLHTGRAGHDIRELSCCCLPAVVSLLSSPYSRLPLPASRPSHPSASPSFSLCPLSPLDISSCSFSQPPFYHSCRPQSPPYVPIIGKPSCHPPFWPSTRTIAVLKASHFHGELRMP